MNGNSWPVDAPSPREYPYLCLPMKGDEILPLDDKGKGISDDQAKDIFQRRYGYHPEYIIANHYRMCWLGPIVEAE